MTLEVGAAGTISPPVEALLHTAKRNEEKGYDAIWYPDHWMAWHSESIWTPDVTQIANFQPNPHVYLDPVACMAAVGVHTETIRLGTSVTEPIRRHPALLANEWLTLDHLTKGRTILGIGAGEAENITPYGLDYSKQVSKFEEALTIIRLLWENDDPVDFDGQFWTLKRAVNGMQPFRPGVFPEIWTGAHGPRMLDITGRLADGWLPSLLPPDDFEQRLTRMRAVAREAGRGDDAITAGMWFLAVVDEDHETAHRLVNDRIVRGFLLTLPDEAFARHGAPHPLGEGAYGLREYIPTMWQKEEMLAALDAIPDEVAHEYILHGTPDEIVATCRDYEARGLQHVVLWNITFLGDLTKVGSSYHLMDDVMRALKAPAQQGAPA
ncbi:MAG TPA: LLM class flavin-dependent oxidoreductase [Actinomycetota bacterium]|nr:LLM class flavin-dependent oxidoreductase [Actinomycetota bacterium]